MAIKIIEKTSDVLNFELNRAQRPPFDQSLKLPDLSRPPHVDASRKGSLNDIHVQHYQYQQALMHQEEKPHRHPQHYQYQQVLMHQEEKPHRHPGILLRMEDAPQKQMDTTLR
uniref:Uncharacterized protein n=1 Tax=Romanomermis culicivorax TaxID=13658 RepID=A0A915JA20_ROMCU